jgi:chemotaxis protein MotA
MQNISTFIGVGIAAVVIWMGVIGHASNPFIFLDSHALILVIGGTLAAGLIAFPIQRFKDLSKFLLYVVFYPPKTGKIKIAEQILRMAGVQRGLLRPWELRDAHHPLLAEGYHLIKKSDLLVNEFRDVLLQRNQIVKDNYVGDAKMLMALAKFPPAFGLLGATTGMIAMMSNLGSGGQDSIGPAMAIALVATFWGIAVANLVLLPLADHANRTAQDQAQVRTMIVAGLVLIHQQASIVMIYEMMTGFLPMNQRNNVTLRTLKDSLEAVPEVRTQDRIEIEIEHENEIGNETVVFLKPKGERAAK